ncbi:MAG: T9SS type A sorting domain-containing protein [Bacteroidota bacterium]
MPLAIAAQDYQVAARIVDNTSVANATLFYRKGGDSTFTLTPMSLRDTVYQGTIPSASITSQGAELYITATDPTNNIGRFPGSGYSSLQVRLTNLSRGTPQDNGSEQTAYRIFSIPINADNRTPQSVLEDNLGAYDNTRWRFYEFTRGQQSVEYPNTAQMEPGKGFWLIVRDAGRVIDTGPGRTNVTNIPFRIPLYQGWNLIGNPFNFAVLKSKINFGSAKPFLYTYAGAWDSTTAREMKPFEGYAVFTFSDTALRIVDTSLTSSENPVTHEVPQWRIRIIGRCQDALDINNLAAVYPSAAAEDDDYDMPEPPQIGEYVSVYFASQRDGAMVKHCVDALPEPTDGVEWNMEVRSNIRDRVTLEFSQLESVPGELEIFLIDDLLKATVNLRLVRSYSFLNSGESHSRKLRLIVGTPSFLSNKLAEVSTIPTSFVLFQNFPNPFNPNTTIRYGLPVATHVSVRVYNQLGQEVAVLTDEVQAAGYKAAEFDGRNLASGVYYYRMQAGQFSEVKKFLLLK